MAKNSLVKSSVCRHAAPPFARKPHARSGNRIWTIYLKSTLRLRCHRACRVPGAGSLDLGAKKRYAQDLHESPGPRRWPSAANTCENPTNRPHHIWTIYLKSTLRLC